MENGRTMNARPRVAAVIQRYGPEVLGGESLCRAVVKRLSQRLDITVLTTCAEDYMTWKNVYPEGPQTLEGVPVIRFPVARPRSPEGFRWVSRVVLGSSRLPYAFLRRVLNNRASRKLWIDMQGPYSPKLIRYIQEHRDRYDVFIFYTYLYFHTVRGLRLVKEKSILVPFAHDEPPIYLSFYRDIFRSAKALVFLTEEEQSFVNDLFQLSGTPQRIAAMKIRTLDDLSTNSDSAGSGIEAFRKSHGLHRPYLLFAGRIEPSKGTDWMFDLFSEFRARSQQEVDLVLIGKPYAPLPDLPWIRYLGFLPEKGKTAAILGSRGVVVPSMFESLSISLLEALGLGKPAIVNADSPIPAGHIQRSGAGFAVSGADEFKKAIDVLLSDSGLRLGRRGVRYVRENFSWEGVDRAYLELIDQLSGEDVD